MSITIAWPQAVWVLGVAIHVMGNAILHGKKVPDSNTRFDVVRAIFQCAVLTGLLYWGGFFE